MTSNEESTSDKIGFAESDQEAQERYNKFKSIDAYPDIVPALLNSADIYDYVMATGMIYPFHQEKLKPASYEVALLGRCVYWDSSGQKHIKFIKKGENFTLFRNSIAFVTLEPMLRLPDYIAIRFNLKISHVYKGILLGTGPLVDPGFDGLLSIPLHNLTNNDYDFVGGKGLIWMEFTKVSPNKIWSSPKPNTGRKTTTSKRSGNQRNGQYVPFPIVKNNLEGIEDYIHKAYPNGSIQSSLSETLEEATKAAQEAKSTARLYRNIAVLGAIATVIAVAAFIAQIAGMIQDSTSLVDQARRDYYELRVNIDTLQTTIALNRNPNNEQIQDLEDKIQDLQKRLDIYSTSTSIASPTIQVTPTP